MVKRRDNQTPDSTILIWRKHTVPLIKIKMKSNKNATESSRCYIWGKSSKWLDWEREYKHKFSNDQRQKSTKKEKEIFFCVQPMTNHKEFWCSS